jgi:hypothetical protein
MAAGAWRVSGWAVLLLDVLAQDSDRGTADGPGEGRRWHSNAERTTLALATVQIVLR